MENFENKLKLSVIIPTYNNNETILETLQSILAQSFTNFELIINDDCSKDNTVDLITTLNDSRIKLYVNKHNLGCGGNLNQCLKKINSDIFVIMSGDDLLDVDALKKIYDAFKISDDIGIVIRTYYWFDENYKKPVRIKKQFKKNILVSINDSFEKIKDVLSLSDQLSAIGFRKKFIDQEFSDKPFIEASSMVLNVLKKSKAIILKDNILAVRISSSSSMCLSVYKNSPMLAWKRLIDLTLPEKRFSKLRKYLQYNFIANNFIGLVQIKNHGNYHFLFREIWYLIKLKWINIFNPFFYFFAIGTIIAPRFFLKKLVIKYKNRFNSKLMPKNISIKLNYGITGTISKIHT